MGTNLLSLLGKKAAKPKDRKHQRTSRLSLENLEERKLLTVSSFQQGVNAYSGQEDTVLYSRSPDVNFGTEGSISPDQQDANGVRQGLVKFDGIIGNSGTQIPLGARINSAELVVNVINDSNSAMQMSIYRMLSDWSESTATWNTFGSIGGVQASEGESSDLPPDDVLYDPDTTANSPTAGRFDVTRSLEYWSAGDSNFGWLFESAATNGWDFRTKESAQSQRPELTVDFSVPAGDEYQILNQRIVKAEGDTGSSTAVIEVARLGPLTGSPSISYTVAAGSADPTDFVAVPNGTLSFAPGQALATIEVQINGDTELEGTEDVIVTLTSGTIVPSRGEATIDIGDDDALINEVLANVTTGPQNQNDETNREYVELIGTPGASLDDYYFVVFEGEEEGDDGTAVGGEAAGLADFVYDLSPHSFGSNGLLVLTPTAWDYAGIADPDTTQVPLAALDGIGGVLEDNSQTYALIRSPNGAIVQGVDYDTVGAYENQTNQAIGFGVGVLDQLPIGADVVDSVGVVEGGGGDRDRVATPEFPGNPGIHVHQPTPFAQGGNVTSDAVSRRVGQKLPNSIGAWFNGDIPNGDIPVAEGVNAPIPYANDTFFISVVAPDGSVLTPGSENVLRNTFFNVDDQDTEVAEVAGSVTLRIERTGDLDEVVTVDYETVDVGSATEGVDYVGVQDSVTFGVGESSKNITITILQDMEAEGFESFRVDITGAPDNYLITNGRSNDPGPSGGGVPNGEATVTITDANVLVATFQDGVNGYNGTSDGYIDGENIFGKFGQDPVVRVDQVKGEGEDPIDVVRPQQGLLRFDNVFGNGGTQVPEGSKIFDAFVTVNVQNVSSGADVRFFRMLQNWEQVNTTWVDPQGNAGNGIVNGVTPDGIEATSEPDARVLDPGRAGLVQIPLNVDTIQSWANGSLDNFGWSIVSDAGSLWAFNSSDAFLMGTFRPELTILYTDPDPGDAGTFSLSGDDFVVNEDDTATITINRFGGSAAEATAINWEITAGTGDLSDITSPSSGSVVFGANEFSKTFDIVIDDDNVLETNETLNLSISGGSLDFDRTDAVLTIRDNDLNPFAGQLLLNEFWINSPGNDPPHEFVELTGEAGLPMGSLYYVAFEGLIGDREGAAEKVVNIGEFFNGAADEDGNGYTILTPDAADFAFNVPSLATQIDGLGSIGQENVASQNDSTTYMILYSPFTSLATTEFDYDWDNDGALELPQGVTIVDSVGVRVLGAEDQLYGPSTNRVSFALSDPDVDAISRFRGDETPNDGDAWFGGDLEPGGDDYLLYECSPRLCEAFDLPLGPNGGTALSPGEPNTGNATESPLVSLQSVSDPAFAFGTGTILTATFSDEVSQLNFGDGGPASPQGAAITITDTAGQPINGIEVEAVVTGLETNTLTISFEGSALTNGQLPDGTYRLNFVGNAIIANARATDVANNGTQIDGFFTHEFTVMGSVNDPDFNGDTVLDCDDLNLLSAEIVAGTNNTFFDLTNDGFVDLADRDEWLALAGAANLVSQNPYLLGDANLDGVVDGQDFVAWNMNKFTANNAYCDGDFNVDGFIDGQDFVVWNGNKFQSAEAVQAVPVVVETASLNSSVPANPVEALQTPALSQNRLAAVDTVYRTVSADNGDDLQREREAQQVGRQEALVDVVFGSFNDVI